MATSGALGSSAALEFQAENKRYTVVGLCFRIPLMKHLQLFNVRSDKSNTAEIHPLPTGCGARRVSPPNPGVRCGGQGFVTDVEMCPL